MTTKEQERKALAQIRKIVDALGEGSYLAATFDGCFELAESNIEFDFGESMKDRAECYRKKVDDLNKELKEAYQAAAAEELRRKRIENENGENKKCADDLRVELAKTRGALQQLQIAAAQVREHTRETYTRRINELNRLMVDAAEAMAVFADTPKDIAYNHAVQNLKKYKAERDELQTGLNMIQKLCE